MNILILNQQDKRINKDKITKLVKKILKNLACPDNAEISILFTDNNSIRELNKRYLKKDRPTDVLSFPMSNPKTPNTEPQTPNLLGDVVISIERAGEQAVLQKVSLHAEVKRLLVHGILHLFGYEHEKGGKNAIKMKNEEKRLIRLINKN